MNRTPDQILEDDMMIAKLIAGAESHPSYRFTRGHFLRAPLFDLYERATVERTGECCAIGAGMLYLGLDAFKVNGSYITAFCLFYGVSLSYAMGISDGFENMDNSSYQVVGAGDYCRGQSIGLALAEAYVFSGEGSAT